MKVFRGFHHPGVAPACALTIGNFDGVHRGHQAMLALLNNEAAHRGVPSCVMTFEPHPRDYFAGALKKPELAPARIATLRDKLTELERCGVQQVVVLPFDARLASQSPEAFINDVLLRGLGVRYVLVGDDFRFGAKRAGDYAMLDAAGQALGFDVARMNSYEVHGLRVSSSAVRDALGTGRLADAARLLGRPYCISGHVVHGRKLGRDLGASTATGGRRLSHAEPALFALEPRRQRHLRGAGARAGVRPPARRGQPGHPPVAGPGRRERRARPARNPLPAMAAGPGCGWWVR
jgi:riboflavin kinase/FMN adenylyltransferase